MEIDAEELQRLKDALAERQKAFMMAFAGPREKPSLPTSPASVEPMNPASMPTQGFTLFWKDGEKSGFVSKHNSSHL
jgi:hypothetical protein